MEKEYIKENDNMLGLIIYVCMSTLGLTLIKMGTANNFSLRIEKAGFQLEMNYLMIIGMVVYIVSFLLSLAVMKKMNLSVFYPISAGLIFILTCILSVVLLKEKVAVNQFIGMGIILIGIVVMNIKK